MLHGPGLSLLGPPNVHMDSRDLHDALHSVMQFYGCCALRPLILSRARSQGCSGNVALQFMHNGDYGPLTVALCAQLAILVLLWAVFLITQMQKSKYGRCSWQFAALFAFQTVLLGGVTFAVLRYESHRFKVSWNLAWHLSNSWLCSI